MRLAQTHTAVDEQGVIGLAGIAGDLDGGRLGELIALALDETVECKTRIDGSTEYRGSQPSCFRRCAAGRLMTMTAVDRRHRYRDAGPRAHIEHQLRRRLLRKRADQLLDPRQRVLAQ